MASIFFVAVLGSLALEVVQVYREYLRDQDWPKRYHDLNFWFVRFLVALVGGIFAIAQDVQTFSLAVQMGVTAPALLQALAKDRPPDAPTQS
jgi:hypothetical protein